jgi:hypothetical protein
MALGLLAVAMFFFGLAWTSQMELSSAWISKNAWVAIVLYGAGVLFTFLAGLAWLRDRRKLTIHLAEWGRGPHDGDYEPVTDIVRGYIKPDNTIEMRAADHVLGDSYPGDPKHLKVKYSHGNKRNAQITVKHNDWLRLPPP